MLRHRCLGDSELGADRLHHFAGGHFAGSKQFEDAAAHRIGQHLEDVHQLPVPGWATSGGVSPRKKAIVRSDRCFAEAESTPLATCAARQNSPLWLMNALPSGEAIHACAVARSTDAPVARCRASPMKARSQPMPTAPGPNLFQRPSTPPVCSSVIRPLPLSSPTV